MKNIFTWIGLALVVIGAAVGAFTGIEAAKWIELAACSVGLAVCVVSIVNGSERKDWKVEHFFMHQGYYTLLFDNEQHMEIVKDTSVNHAIVERIHFDTRSVEQYIFYRIRGAWMLTMLRNIPFSKDVNATFLTFYQQFVKDKSFQEKSLAETVKFVGPDPDDDFNMMEGIITPDTWEAFAPELPKKMIYNIIYGKPKREGDSKIFVMRGIANGLEVEMTFKRKKGDWKLVKLTT